MLILTSYYKIAVRTVVISVKTNKGITGLSLCSRFICLNNRTNRPTYYSLNRSSNLLAAVTACTTTCSNCSMAMQVNKASTQPGQFSSADQALLDTAIHLLRLHNLHKFTWSRSIASLSTIRIIDSSLLMWNRCLSKKFFNSSSRSCFCKNTMRVTWKLFRLTKKRMILVVSQHLLAHSSQVVCSLYKIFRQ